MQWTDIAGRFSFYGDQMVGLPISQHESIQLGRGDGATLALTACGRDLVMQRVFVGPEMITRTVPDPDWAAISIALRWKGDRIFNGTRVRPYDLIVSLSADGYETICAERDVIMLGIRRQRLEAACAALLSLASEEIQLRDLAFNMGHKQGGSLHSILTNSLLSITTAENKNFAAIQPHLADDIIDAIARAIAPELVGDIRNPSPKCDAREVVHRALGAFVDLSRPPGISDLCSAAAVGETRLYEFFVEVFNVSPARFVRMRRLSEARRRLLDRGALPSSVKEVAMELGFGESGRFAHYYESIFGEYPSMTLERAQSGSTSRK